MERELGRELTSEESVDHRCPGRGRPNKRCVSPFHLEVVSLAENGRRAHGNWSGVNRPRPPWPGSPAADDAFRAMVDAVAERGPMDRNEIAEATGIKREYVAGLLRDMEGGKLPSRYEQFVVVSTRRNGAKVYGLAPSPPPIGETQAREARRPEFRFAI